MIDISALNAYIIFKEVYPNWQTTQIQTMRRNFLRELGFALAKPYMTTRKGMPRTAPAASLLSSVSRESSISREDSPTIPPDLANSSFCASSPDISRKRSKSAPPQPQGRSRCHIC